MTYDLAITGGAVASGRGTRALDVFVSGGRISAVRPARRAKPSARRVIDARGLLVMPGVIDAHVHFQLKLAPGKYTSDDFVSGSAAAVLGGTTTFIDYTGQAPGESPAAGLAARRREAEGRCYADYSFHCMLTGLSRMARPQREMAAAVKAGAPTFKMFTAYGARGLMAGDAELFAALGAARELDALVCVHAENGPVIDLLADRYAPSRGIAALALSRPPFTELEAVGRVIQLAAAAGAPVYLVHLSCEGSAELVAAARRSGLKVMGETCPQYLSFDDTLLKGPRGHLYSCCPPLRKKSDTDRLWHAAASGELQVIATDNCTFTSAQKAAWGGDVRRLPMGLPGAGTLLRAAYTFGVKAGRMSMADLVRNLCENPARIMGLGAKGFIAPGFDADLVLLDPSASEKADWRRLGHNTDYSPWQGMRLYGAPKYTLLRGEVAAEGGELARPARKSGRFVARSTPRAV